MMVDSHLHIWRAVTSGTIPATIVSGYSDVPLKVYKQYMDEHGVDRAVLVQPLFPGSDCSYVADCAAAEPDKFAAVCVVDPRVPEAPDQLSYWAQARSCRGLRIRPRVPAEEESFGQPSTFPVWERAAQLGMVINLLANPPHLPMTAKLAERFPTVPIILDHLGHPDVAAGVDSPAFQELLDLARFPNVYLKVTGYYYFSQQAYPFRDTWDMVRAVYDRFGAARLMWGSDFPHVLLKTGYQRNLGLPARAFPYWTAPDRAQIMGDTAARLYFP